MVHVDHAVKPGGSSGGGDRGGRGGFRGRGAPRGNVHRFICHLQLLKNNNTSSVFHMAMNHILKIFIWILTSDKAKSKVFLHVKESV
jgi:hypothetical protein